MFIFTKGKTEELSHQTNKYQIAQQVKSTKV